MSRLEGGLATVLNYGMNTGRVQSVGKEYFHGFTYKDEGVEQLEKESGSRR